MRLIVGPTNFASNNYSKKIFVPCKRRVRPYTGTYPWAWNCASVRNKFDNWTLAPPKPTTKYKYRIPEPRSRYRSHAQYNQPISEVYHGTNPKKSSINQRLPFSTKAFPFTLISWSESPVTCLASKSIAMKSSHNFWWKLMSVKIIVDMTTCFSRCSSSKLSEPKILHFGEDTIFVKIWQWSCSSVDALSPEISSLFCFWSWYWLFLPAG